MGQFEDAVIFAAQVHNGMIRKAAGTPYLVHPIEVAAIASSITNDPEVLSAAVLHDVLEDTPTSKDELYERFGERVTKLVLSETENKRKGEPPRQTWMIRKEESLKELEEAEDPGVQIVWLADKLSNMRSFYRLYAREGMDLWSVFNQPDPAAQMWYYERVRDLTMSLQEHAAWQEYAELIKIVFREVKE